MDASRWGDPADRDVHEVLLSQARHLYDDARLMPMLRQLVRITCELSGAVGGSVSLIDPDAGRYTKIAELGASCRLGHSFPLDEGVTGQVMDRRAPLVLARYREVRVGHLQVGHPAWDGAVVAIPIWWRADIVAVNVIFAGVARPFTTGEVDSLELVTQVVAPVLVSAVERELPDKVLTRRHDAPFRSPTGGSFVRGEARVYDVVSGLMDLAHRSSLMGSDTATGLSVRVVREDERPRLLVRREAASSNLEDSSNWHELLDDSDGVRTHPLVSGRDFRDVDAHLPGREAGQGTPFSVREMGVVQLLAQGLSDRAIANRLCLSPKTVEKHVSAILRKTGTTSRTAAVVRCMEHDWIP